MLYHRIPNSRQKFVNGKFFIKILIETVSISYKLCDDFGLFFKPLIQVQIDKQSIQITSCEDDKLNISENSDINVFIKMAGITDTLLSVNFIYIYFLNCV